MPVVHCLNRCVALQEITRPHSTAFQIAARFCSSQRASHFPVDIVELLSKKNASWSISDLLPNSDKRKDLPDITSTQLRHLLRLSALPPPKDIVEEKRMIETLRTQLHFVKDIQGVNTEGVEPLQAIRDETEQGVHDRTISVKTLEKDLSVNEEVIGRNKRPRRKREVEIDTKGAEDWDVLGLTERKMGRYFVVDSSPESKVESS